MSGHNSRTAIQLRLLTISRCISDLINRHRINHYIACSQCIIDNDPLSYDILYRHRAVIGNSNNPLASERCLNCSRHLSLVRPAYCCSTCFNTIIDFLCTRTQFELEGIEGNSEPTVIALEQRLISNLPR